ncbi:MAG: hypothetical protein JWO69_1978, partial [Thermoleophilia bacterium]|nr:hypothetical protein [Thermoleophilia bacterium]
MALLRDLIDSVLFPDREVHAIPVLDGAFSPNNRLDASRPLGAMLPHPDDLAMDAHGSLYVSSQDIILRCTGPDFEERQVFARLPGQVGGLACAADGSVLACVSGTGVVVLSPHGQVLATIDAAGGEPIRCPTAVAVADDGTVFVTDGSRTHAPQDWLPDLMKRLPPSGRLIAIDPAGSTRVLADKLSWPGGVAPTRDGSEILVTEAWSHRLVAVPRQGGQPRVVVKNFAGYPARIAPDGGTGYWLAFFG